MSIRPITRQDTLPDHRVEDAVKEYEKCRNNPHYFATKYLYIGGEPFRTRLTEAQFNRIAQAIGRSERKTITVPIGMGKGKI